MNKENSDIVNKFLLIGDRFMPEMHLWDPIVKKYSACGPFTKHRERINEFMKDGRLSHIAKNKLDAACCQHDSGYDKYKDFSIEKKYDIVLKNNAYKIATDPKVDGYQRRLAAKLMVIKEVYSSFKDNIWGVDLADMQLISKYNKGIRYLLCVIDLFSRYGWVIPLKNKKGESIVEGFQKILDSSDKKPSKIWVDHRSEFYNKKFKGFFFKKNDIKMYSTFNEIKSVIAERFIKTFYKSINT